MSLISLKRIQSQFILGVFLGLCAAFIVHTLLNVDCSQASNKSDTNGRLLLSDVTDWSSESNEDLGVKHDYTEEEDQTTLPNEFEEDYSAAKDLYKKVRVLCWIMTSPKNLHLKAIHVRNTWGPRCNVLLFMSSVEDKNFPTIGLNVEEGRRHLTAKTMLAFSYIYDNHFDDADWFMKADDDTYVIVENLRYLLSGEDFKKAVYFGHIFKSRAKKQGYTSGGGGYVLSKEALRRFGEIGRKDPYLCEIDGGPEDVQMGICLRNLEVLLKTSLDALGKSRFHCFDADAMIRKDFPDWYYRYDSDRETGGMENISDYAITFHHITPDKMYSMEYYAYHLKPYGIAH